MRRIKTLRARFALWTASLFLVILTIFGIYVYLSMAHGLSTAIDNSLTLSASQLAAGLNIDNGQVVPSESLNADPENANLRGRGFNIRILTSQENRLKSLGNIIIYRYR